MPWDVIKLNDGTSVPNIAFGTWTLGQGQQSTDKVDQAISVGFNHIGMFLGDTVSNFSISYTHCSNYSNNVQIQPSLIEMRKKQGSPFMRVDLIAQTFI